ncbi:MAG: hypothetical protein OXK80_04455 [Bdellovibrionales bacterium]|nr:hypothetical protein [Bdellovibrionales bacterium]
MPDIDFQENVTRNKKEWMSYEEAKTFIQAQGIKTSTQFLEWKRAGKRPKNFPSTPWKVYKDEWTSWGDFAGTKNVSARKKEWMSFEEAKTYIQNLGIKTRRQFKAWTKSEQRPENFPSAPWKVYKDKWISLSDFLGTENISTRKMEWMSYEEARTFIQAQGIKTKKQFQEWVQSKKRPDNFPSVPWRTYKDEWISLSDFLGTKNISTRKKEWMSFKEAKAYIQAQGIKTSTQFLAWRKAGKRPKNFPFNPDKTYKNEWINWGDFLGTKNVSTRKIEWMSYEEARTFIQTQDIKTKKQFQEWAQSNKRPENFPRSPQSTYKDQWDGWGDFLGTGNTIAYMKYSTARKYVQSLNFDPDHPKEFIEWLKSSDRPVHFPPNPHHFYSEWTSVKDFLSTDKTEMSYEEAKVFVQPLGLSNSRDFFDMMKFESDVFPENFPNNPQVSYKNTGDWIDWNDFLVSRPPFQLERWVNFRKTLDNKKSSIDQEENIETKDLELEEYFADEEENTETEDLELEENSTEEIELQSTEIY